MARASDHGGPTHPGMAETHTRGDRPVGARAHEQRRRPSLQEPVGHGAQLFDVGDADLEHLAFLNVQLDLDDPLHAVRA